VWFRWQVSGERAASREQSKTLPPAEMAESEAGMTRRGIMDRLTRPTKSYEQRGMADADAVRLAFLPTSFVQLRVLPNQLGKGPARKAGRSLRGNESTSLSLAQTSRTALMKQQLQTVAGTLTPRAHGVSSKLFSTFSYQPSEYDLERSERAKARYEHQSKILGGVAIKTGMPTIPAKQVWSALPKPEPSELAEGSLMKLAGACRSGFRPQ